MAKRKQWDEFKNKMSCKRTGKKERTDEVEYLTVQQLSATVEGKAQKYSRIGPLTMVPYMHKDKTMENIKQACKDHFGVDEMYQCDILAGERGPSYTAVNQIKNWKLLHIRFVESESHGVGSRKRCKGTSNMPKKSMGTTDQAVRTSTTPHQGLSNSQAISVSGVTSGSCSQVVPSFARSVPLSQLIKMGKLIPPKKDVITLQLEHFDVSSRCWQDPFEAVLSVSIDKFASGGCRDAFLATGLKGLNGKLVVKRYRPERIKELENLFHSLDDHTRKVVQMHALARYFSLLLHDNTPPEFGDTFLYTKLYYAKLKDETVTVEQYIEGDFTKYVNNTGEIIIKDNSEVAQKAESFTHFSYVKSGKQFIIVDLQGVGYTLCDPEIASSKLFDDDDNSIYFCAGNLSTTAIDTFFSQHKCNKFCTYLNLDK